MKNLLLCWTVISMFCSLNGMNDQGLWVKTTNNHLSQVPHNAVKASNLLTVLNEKYKGTQNNPLIIPAQLSVDTTHLNMFCAFHTIPSNILYNTLDSHQYFHLIEATDKLKAQKKYIDLITEILPQEDSDAPLRKKFSSHITKRWIGNLIRNDAIKKKLTSHIFATGESYNTHKPKLRINDDGDFFAHGILFGFGEPDVTLCNTNTNTQEYGFNNMGHVDPLRFSPDGTYIVSRETFGIYLYNMITKEKYLLVDHQNLSLDITISENSQRILIEGRCKYAESLAEYTMWTLDAQNIPQPTTLKNKLAYSHSAIFHPDNEHIIHTHSKLYLYDILTHERKNLTPNIDENITLAHRLTFSPDKAHMLCNAWIKNGSDETYNVFFNIEDFTNVTSTPIPSQSLRKEYKKYISPLCIPHKHLLTHITNEGCTLQLLDENATPVASHTTKENIYISALAVDNSGDYIASGYSDGTVILWDLSDAKKRIRGKKLIGSKGTITKLTFTDNQLLLSQSKNGELWNTNNPIATPGTAILWDVEGNQILNFGNAIVNSKISKNGKKIITIDVSLHWNDRAFIPNWKLFFTLTCHNLDVKTDTFTLKQALDLFEKNENDVEPKFCLQEHSGNIPKKSSKQTESRDEDEIDINQLLNQARTLINNHHIFLQEINDLEKKS